MCRADSQNLYENCFVLFAISLRRWSWQQLCKGLIFFVTFTQPFGKKCALNWVCTKPGFYYIKKLVTQKWCTKLSECTKSECTKPGEDCTFIFNILYSTLRCFQNMKTGSYLIKSDTLQIQWIFPPKNPRRMAAVQPNCLILSLGWPKIYEFSLVKCKRFKTNPTCQGRIKKEACAI